MTRNEALAAGYTTYSTGKPCKHGHDSPRYASCGVCVICLREARDRTARVHNTIAATRTKDAALFAYKLHPEDHAAALAYCQSLDLQRGRQPAAGNLLAAPMRYAAGPGEFQLPDIIARHRAQIEAAGAPQVAAHVPGEMARHLSDER